MADMTEPSHDVVIVGGGLVGASLAIALEQLTGLDVALVEAAPPQAMPAVFDQRNLSFAAATVNALTAMGVMRKLQARTGLIRHVHISRQGDFGSVRLNAADYGRAWFGQVVVARDFGTALEQRLSELQRLTRYRPTRFVGSSLTEDGRRCVRLQTHEGEQVLRARLLVAADGTRSAVRDALGIGTQEHDYRQTAFVARVRAGKTPSGVAYERLRDEGPLALMPRGDGHFGAIFCVDSAFAAAMAVMTDAEWLRHLQQVFGWREGRFLECGERSAYPLIRVVAEQVTSERAVLLGNAAQTIHPIGAQGFNLGLRDALTLAEEIAGAGDPGDTALLQRHAQRRDQDRQRTLAFSDGLARITSNPSALLRPLRSLGLAAIGGSATLQSFLVGGAMGYRGDVPALCREEAA